MAVESRRLYVGNFEEWNEQLRRENLVDDELEVKVIQRAVVLPSRKIKWGIYQGGVCDENLNFVAGHSKKKSGVGGFNTLESAYEIDRNDIVQLDEDVIFGGLLAMHFGHFLTESLSRLWYVVQHPELKSKKVLFVTTLNNGGHFKFSNKIFSLMGIEEERIIYVDKPLQCRSITVPDQAQYDWTWLTKEFFLPYQAIKARVKPAQDEQKKLYLTRLGFEFQKHGNVHCFNEKYFEDFFAARGFKVVSMEKLDIKEQVSLIMGADEIAANLSTLTHWAIFCKPGTKFIMLNRTSSYVSNIQATFNKALNLDWYIVDASKNFLYADRTNGVCMFGSNIYWKDFVADYFGEEVDEDEAQRYFKEALDDYLNFWLNKYSEEKDRLLDSLKKMCLKINSLELETSRNRPVLINYQTHVARGGWERWKLENEICNPHRPQSDIQAIKINSVQPVNEVYYSVYYNEKEGWSDEVSAGKMAGTTGKNKPITGIKIWLDEKSAKKFDIFYRVHTFDDVWTSWLKNGEEFISGGIKLNSIQIKLEDKLSVHDDFKNLYKSYEDLYKSYEDLYKSYENLWRGQFPNSLHKKILTNFS